MDDAFGQRRALEIEIVRVLGPGETVDAQVTYVMTHSLATHALDVLAGIRSMAAGLVLTSLRLLVVQWDDNGEPHLIGAMPRAGLTSSAVKRGFLSDSFSLNGPDGFSVRLTAAGVVRPEAREFAALLQ